MIKHKFLTLLVALCATTALWASNVITYTATEKLSETTSSSTSGLHTNAFNVKITSHKFSNGVGTITFDGEVTTIGEDAFYKCSGLTSVTIPNSVTEIGKGAFFYCKGLTSIDVDAANTHYASVDGVLFNYAKDILIQCPAGNSRTEYTIPNSVTTIGDEAFRNCSGLTSVTIPNSVTTIGSCAFFYCSGLTSVTIPNSVTTIGYMAFYHCSGLTSVTIGNSVTTIRNDAFAYCSGLTSVTFLGKDCQNNIGVDAFYGVGNPDPALLTLPDNWTGTLPYEDGTWYGGKFELSEDPTALPTLFGANVDANKFLYNGQVIIRKNGKTYNTLGQEVK